ncbi:MAG: N-acetylmuramoyl-L-alanine amidase [Tannerella sp.]|jgi:N-acetylmuramoyl-L-alanine amidase|nr:N-acetylmuramoyl-L-alanine amidase [Tannerella sp.]
MEIKQNLLTKNQFSRPGTLLQGVWGVVLHWVANPQSTAVGNRNYFENLKSQPYETEKDKKKARFASVHFVIGLQGEIIQCLPENEMAYHMGAAKYTPRALGDLSSYPNNCTIGIELCHIDWDGKFTPETLKTTKELILDLCKRYNLGKHNIYRHYDITGKDCPQYFVTYKYRWIDFLESLEQV